MMRVVAPYLDLGGSNDTYNPTLRYCAEAERSRNRFTMGGEGLRGAGQQICEDLRILFLSRMSRNESNYVGGVATIHEKDSHPWLPERRTCIHLLSLAGHPNLDRATLYMPIPSCPSIQFFSSGFLVLLFPIVW